MGSTCYSYTIEGWVEWILQDLPGNEIANKLIEYEYDLQGKVTKVRYNPEESDAFYFWYEYNELGQLWKVYSTGSDAKPSAADAVYTYTPSGQLDKLVLNEGNSQEVMDYAYTVRDWLDNINASGINGVFDSRRNSDINFAEKLYYHNPPSESGVGVQFNGNISVADYYSYREGVVQYSATGSHVHRYAFSYDALSRLTNAQFFYDPGPGYFMSDGNEFKVNIGNYDLMGNIVDLTRYNEQAVYQDLHYNYYSNTNKLNSVDGLNSANNYQYDANGNLIRDLVKLGSNGVVLYDNNNMPIKVSDTSGKRVSFGYNDTSSRIYKKYRVNNSLNQAQYYIQDASGRTLAVYDAAGNLMFMNLFGMDNIGKIKKEGSSVAKSYYLKDHLGNIRVTLNDDGNVIGYDDYYPFGLQMPGRCNNTSNPNSLYKYNGKELDEELDWYHFGMRYYDPAIGRWMVCDPMADLYPSTSPYVYCLNNPLILVDPTGMVVETTEEDLEKLKQMLPEEADKYLEISDGKLNAEKLAEAKLDNENYSSILELAESKEIYVFSSGKEITMIDANGKKHKIELNEYGTVGLTLSKDESLSGKNEIMISDALKGERLPEWSAHEIGHAVFLDRGKDWLHRIEYDEKLGGHTDKNIPLKNYQNKLIRNAIKNYKRRNKK